MLNKISLVIAILALIVGGFAFTTKDSVLKVGANPGPEYTARQFFFAGSTSGGRVATTSAAATYTLVAKDFNGTPTYIDWLPNVDTTLSIGATSTHQYVPRVGDVANVYLRNASTTAGATVTLAAVDSGVDLQYTEATGGDLVLNGLDWGVLTFIRESDNLVTVLFSEFTEAD